MRVVLIDDEDDIRFAMTEVLAIHLPDVVEISAFDPADYDEIDWTGCHVAIIDLMMPGRDGESVLAELRDNQPEVYRVAWTAKDDRSRQKVAESGLAHAVVGKPGFDEILALLNRTPKP